MACALRRYGVTDSGSSQILTFLRNIMDSKFLYQHLT
jgi:hypothetical protein